MYKHISKLSYSEIAADLETDSFYKSLNEEQRKILLEQIERRHFCSNTVDGIWRGDIKVCYKEQKVRVTTCAACGCGECLTCGERYFCVPVPTLSENYFSGMISG